MGLIPNDIINAVLDRSDIATTIGRYISLKKAGRNFKALCPFHNEKSPSFVVNPDKQIFHCFGCGAGGNAIGFVMRQEHLEFPQAVRLMAEQCGITILEDGEDAQSPSRKLRDDIYKVNDLAVGYFHELLLASRDESAKNALEYLKGRNIELDTVKQFQLGFAADEWDGLIKFLSKKDISVELMEQSGLVIAREQKAGYYDRFRNRVMFPIFDIQSRAVAFGARAMPDSRTGKADAAGAKYINSPETAIYTKGRHMFGLNLAKTAAGKLDQMFVVEGYMDMIMPYVHGVENLAASLGTALTVEQIRLVRRYTQNVVMLFDTDPAGQNAIIRSLDMLIEEGMNVRVVTLAQDEDPDSFIRIHGVDAFRARLKLAQPLFDFKLDWLTAQYGQDTVEGRSKICQQMQSTIGRYRDEVVKFELTRALSEKFNIPVDVLLKQSAMIKRPESFVPSRIASELPPLSIGLKRAEEMLLALFLSDPAWVRQAKEVLILENFAEGIMRDVVRQLWECVGVLEEWDSKDFQGILSDPQAQTLVTRLLAQDERWLGNKELVFKDCVDGIIKERLQKQKTMARQSGDFQRVDELIRQTKRKT